MTSVIGLGGEGQKAGQGQARQLGFHVQGIQVREFHIRLQDSFPAGMVNQEACQCENVGFRAEKGVMPGFYPESGQAERRSGNGVDNKEGPAKAEILARAGRAYFLKCRMDFIRKRSQLLVSSMMVQPMAVIPSTAAVAPRPLTSSSLRWVPLSKRIPAVIPKPDAAIKEPMVV
jgi:hypothetical protein